MYEKNAWGYAIDYDKEIAQGELELAAVERMIRYGWYNADGFACGLWDLLEHSIVAPGGLPGFPLTEQERGDMIMRDGMSGAVELPEGYEKGSYRDWSDRLDVLMARVMEASGGLWLPRDLERAKKERSRIKAKLARYRRNKAKNGA